jgi:type I restriction enzyme M protein
MARSVNAYSEWRGDHLPEGWNEKVHGGWYYEDEPGFCKATTIEGIGKQGFVLTPGRYVGAEEQEDDGEPFEEKYPRLLAELEDCFDEGERLMAVVREQLDGVFADGR